MKTDQAQFSRTLFCCLILLAGCAPSKSDIPVQEKDFCAAIHQPDSTTLSNELSAYSELCKTKTGVFVLEDGSNALITRAWLSENAEKSIDVQYFIFSTDNVGLIASDYLVRAADRGVKVRILVDDLLFDVGIHEILTLDSHDNIEIRVYNPGLTLGKNLASKIKKFAVDYTVANQRMHNKTFNVDNRVVITGGRNIADEYFDFDQEFNFRDRDVLLIGKAVGDVRHSFEKFWSSSWSVPVHQLVSEENPTYSDAARFERLHQYACNPENFWPQVREKIKHLPQSFETIRKKDGLVWVDSVDFISDPPGKNDGTHGMNGGGTTTDSLIRLVKHAKKSITIQSPYLVTTDLARDLFRDAVNRGVAVTIMTNSLLSNDNFEAFNGYQRNRKELLETGVRIFEFKPDAEERFKIMEGGLQEKLNYKPVFGLHAKTMVVDGEIAVIGTFNLDPRSANLNTECITIIHSHAIAAGVLKGIELEMRPENSWETTLKFNPDKEAGLKTRMKAFSKRVVPKNIL